MAAGKWRKASKAALKLTRKGERENTKEIVAKAPGPRLKPIHWDVYVRAAASRPYPKCHLLTPRRRRPCVPAARRLRKVAGTVWDVDTSFGSAADIDVRSALAKLETVFTIEKPSKKKHHKHGDANGGGGDGEGSSHDKRKPVRGGRWCKGWARVGAWRVLTRLLSLMSRRTAHCYNCRRWLRQTCWMGGLLRTSASWFEVG